MPNEGMNKQTEQRDDWETPGWLFKALDAEFGFTLDGAANEQNAKCSRWCAELVNEGFYETCKIWTGERVFCNPPYSMIEDFVDQVLVWCNPEIAVLLLPVRTDTDWFHKLFESPRVSFRWFRKRIAFELNGKSAGSPRFASFIAIVRPK